MKLREYIAKKMKTEWENFYNESVRKILEEKKDILDIGGGLRVIKSNRIDPTHSWMIPLIKKVNLKVVDPVPDYGPDIVADIHNLPMAGESIDAIFCIAVLEHVENPIKAVEEMHRVLKKGGYMFLYVPFLYYYHAHGNYYKDYWRFTPDSINYMCRNFSSIKTVSSRYALEMWVRLSPLGRFDIFVKIFRRLDKIFGKTKTKQVTGYYVLAQK